MFHKIKTAYALPEYRLCIQFSEGKTKIYDVKPLMKKYDAFKALENEELFACVEADVGGYGVIWNDDIDISCDELFENGTEIKTPFDDLMSFNDATTLWGLNESTLRKAVAYGKLIQGVDVAKFGKQWVITLNAMQREYGNPLQKT